MQMSKKQCAINTIRCCVSSRRLAALACWPMEVGKRQDFSEARMAARLMPAQSVVP